MAKFVSGVAKLALTGKRRIASTTFRPLIPPPPRPGGSFSKSFSRSFSGGGP